MRTREKLVLAGVGLVVLGSLVVVAVAVGLAAAGLAERLGFPPGQARDGDPSRPGSPEAAGTEPSEGSGGSERIAGGGVPASRTDMDDRETYMRVTGAEGLIFLCRMDDAETPEEGIKFETEVPGEYELELGDEGLATAYLADTGSFWSGIEDPWLRAEIFHDGRVVGRAETREPGGVLYVGWSPDAPAPPEDRPDTVTVRVAGEDGMRFDGTIGRGSRTAWRSASGQRRGVPERVEIRGVRGVAPAEYEVPLDLDSELALANFTEDVSNEVDGELEVELIHDGEVVERTGPGERGGPLGTSWPAPEGE